MSMYSIKVLLICAKKNASVRQDPLMKAQINVQTFKKIEDICIVSM